MNEIDRLRKNVFDNLQEIERLNNIINELEKWLNKITKLTANIDEKMTCNNVLDKLKELKEGR